MNLRNYQSFFNTEEGRALIDSIEQLILANYQRGEEGDADKFLARAYGNREVLNLILSLKAPLKGGSTE